MGRPTYKIKGYSSNQIKALFNTEDKYKIGLRLYAVYQVSLGKPSRDLEDLYGTSFKQILNWVHQFEKNGIDGLRDKEGKGRKPKLTEAQKEEIKEVILHHSPTEYNYNTETWTGPMLIDLIKNNYNIIYKKAQIYNIIKSLGFTYQRGKGFYPEADPKLQEKFKNDLKKNSGKL